MKKKSLLKICVSLILISLSAQLTLNVGDIPITGQTFAVLFVAFFLSPIEAVIALSSYLILGAIGLPVFADGESGINKLTGGTAGFLFGFVVAGGLVSYLYQRSKRKDWIAILLLTTLGTIVIVFMGVVRLSFLYGFEKAISYGFTPFWKGAIIKILLGTFTVVAVQTIYTKTRRKTH